MSRLTSGCLLHQDQRYRGNEVSFGVCCCQMALLTLREVCWWEHQQRRETPYAALSTFAAKKFVFYLGIRLNILGPSETLGPEGGFANYLKSETTERRYTDAEADLRDLLMERCFEVCKGQSQNFICLAIVVFQEARDYPYPSTIKNDNQ
jgi:hypothetical protein